MSARDMLLVRKLVRLVSVFRFSTISPTLSPWARNQYRIRQNQAYFGTDCCLKGALGEGVLQECFYKHLYQRIFALAAWKVYLTTQFRLQLPNNCFNRSIACQNRELEGFERDENCEKKCKRINSWGGGREKIPNTPSSFRKGTHTYLVHKNSRALRLFNEARPWLIF